MTARFFDIPMKPSQAQKVAVVLSGSTYNLTFSWCYPAQFWVVEIADVTGTVIASGVPLVTGHGLLEQLGYLGIVGDLLVQTEGDADAVPTFDSLGDTGHLYYVTPS